MGLHLLMRFVGFPGATKCRRYRVYFHIRVWSMKTMQGLRQLRVGLIGLGLGLALTAGLIRADMPDVLQVGVFSRAQAGGPYPEPWKPLTFKQIEQHTHYSLVQDNGTVVVQAESRFIVGIDARDHNRPADIPNRGMALEDRQAVAKQRRHPKDRRRLSRQTLHHVCL